jgi:peroxiredoxin
MVRKILAGFLLVSGLSALAGHSWAASALPGRPAPPFAVESGDSQKLTRDMILGKVVVLFYENRQAVDKNEELKNELQGLYRVQPEHIKQEIFRLLVIDCSEACRPAIPLWKTKLSENSRIQGFTIYGDWDRRMLMDYHLQGDDSNFLIIDKQGIIRYATTGKIGNGQIQKIKELLCSLVKGG